MMKLLLKLISLSSIGVVCHSAMAERSSESTTIGVNPAVTLFKNIEVGAGSAVSQVVVNNKGNGALTIHNVSVLGVHADQFLITNNGCNTQLAVDEECVIDVSYTPTARGYKQAVLNIESDSSDTPELQVFLTSRENQKVQAARRLPPVLYDLSIPETMISGTSYTLEWSILGYHDDYLSSLALFDCTGITNSSCGDQYESNMFTMVGSKVGKTKTNWHSGDIDAYEHKFSVPFTPSLTEETDIVVRFYRLNSDDKTAGGGGLSLIIPGNLSDEYYDKQGRRIKKKILP